MDEEMSPEPQEGGAPPVTARVVWKWFRLVGVPVIAIMAIVTAIVLLRAPSDSGTGGTRTDAGDFTETGDGAVSLDRGTLGALPTGGSAPEEGKPAPDFTLQAMDGTTYRLSDLRGHPVMINFWATWCGPCKQEMPAIEEQFRARGSDIVILAINVEESRDKVEPYLSKLGITFPVLLDKSGTVSGRYRVRALPTTYFIKPDGTVDGSRIGPYSRSLLQQRLDQIIAGD